MGASKSRADRAEEMRALLKEWEESDESIARFAARSGVRAKTLYRWRQRLRIGEKTVGRARRASADGKAVSATSPMFTEVSARPSSPAAVAAYEVVLSDGTTVRVPEDFDPGTLKILLSTLRQC